MTSGISSEINSHLRTTHLAQNKNWGLNSRLAWNRFKDRVMTFILGACGVFSIFISIAIVYILISESATFFENVSLKEFLFDLEWSPLFSEPHFGIWPLLCGTIMTSMIALLVAIPAGTLLACYLSEFLSRKKREFIKPLIELLAAVPSVVYGYFALLYISPFLKEFFPEMGGFSILSAGLAMGIMIIPYVTSLSEDSMQSVPHSLREASLAMGANRLETTFRVVLPASFSGLTSSYILAISRAVGETMVVAIAAGMQPTLTLNPLQPSETITAFIVQVSQGDLPHGSIGYQSIFAVGLVLFLMTLVFNSVGLWLRKKYREVYQ